MASFLGYVGRKVSDLFCDGFSFLFKATIVTGLVAALMCVLAGTNVLAFIGKTDYVFSGLWLTNNHFR